MKLKLTCVHILMILFTKENKEKLKKGFNLINRPQRKFEPSIMVAGGVCS